jgi:hypothetical protein
MRYIGCIKRTDTMVLQGVAKFGFFTCPICKQAISDTASGVMGHLVQHVKKGVMPKNHVGYIAMMIRNRKGCNKIIEGLDHDVKEYVLNFVGAMRGDRYARADPVGNRVQVRNRGTVR